MPICPRCGIVAPVQRTSCSVCNQPFTEPRVRAPNPKGPYWVAMRASFQCRSCAFLSPLDHIDVDGEVQCSECGLRQRFDVDAWLEGLAQAHAMGDLAGPAPEGRNPHPTIWIGGDNPFAEIGDAKTYASHKQSGMSASEGVPIPRSLIIDMAPGFPVCRRCAVPLQVGFRAADQPATQCPRCGETASYALPEAAKQRCGGLVAAIAEEHRTDRKAVRMEAAAGGVVALHCPDCGAPITQVGTDVVQCPFCRCVARIPVRAQARPTSGKREPVWFWLLFEGPSAMRRNLEQPPADTAEKLLKLAGPMAKNALKKVLGEVAKPGFELGEPVKGVHWAQVALTLGLPSLAVAIAIVVAILVD